jgi:hypothetical protein
MPEEGYQKELFEFERPKRSFPRLRLFPKGSQFITLTMEKVVFLLIGLVMAVIVVYALGVEGGKRYAERQFAQRATKTIAPIATSSMPARPVSASTSEVKNIPESPLPLKGAGGKILRPAGAAETPGEKDKPYTIVAATFARKGVAQAEADRLKKGGLSTYLTESEPYFLVCVGTYADKDSAASRKALTAVRRFYKDAYFKLR